MREIIHIKKGAILMMVIILIFVHKGYALENNHISLAISDNKNPIFENTLEKSLGDSEFEIAESEDPVSNLVVRYDNTEIGIDVQKTYFIPGAGFSPKKDRSSVNFTNELIDTCLSSFGNDFKVIESSSKKIPFKPLRAGINGRWAILNGYKPIDYNSHPNIMRTVMEIESDFQASNNSKVPNIIGSSYGSVVAAQSVIALLERNNNIDTIGVVVITASMIHPESELALKLMSLEKQGKIQSVYFYPNPNDNITACSGKSKKEAKQGFMNVVFRSSPSITNMKDHKHNIAALDVSRAHHLLEVIIKSSPITWLKNRT